MEISKGQKVILKSNKNKMVVKHLAVIDAQVFGEDFTFDQYENLIVPELEVQRALQKASETLPNFAGRIFIATSERDLLKEELKTAGLFMDNEVSTTKLSQEVADKANSIENRDYKFQTLARVYDNGFVTPIAVGVLTFLSTDDLLNSDIDTADDMFA
jgi:hypothetical protein